MIHSTAMELEAFIDQHLPALRNIPEADMLYKISDSKWSKKEILGHTIDSAQNNIRRFIVAQYEDEPKIVYAQDKWVGLSGYQQYDLPDLVNLWYFLNKHICNILGNILPEMAQRSCQTEAPHTIEWLAQDYLKHLRHHVHQVLDLEPVAYP